MKLFNISSFLVDHFRKLSNQFYTDNRQPAIRRSLWGTGLSLVGTAGYYGAYVYIILGTVQGHLSIGDLTFLAGSFRQLRGLLESILSRFTDVLQGTVYLKDFFDFFTIQPSIKTVNDARAFPNPIVQSFSFKNVGFKYINSNRWANRHLAFTIGVGEKLALVGNLLS